MVYLPAAKVLFLGELFQNSYFPRIDSRNVHEWIDALRQVEKWDVEVYVPGHGAPGGKKELAEFRQFLEWFGKEVETRFQEGKSISEVKHEVGPLLEKYKWHAPELVSEDLEAVYKQMVKTQRLKGQPRNRPPKLPCPYSPRLSHRRSRRSPQKIVRSHLSFSYSSWACFRMGMSGSASFQRARKSWYAARAFAVSP